MTTTNSDLHLADRIYVAGHSGLAGSALLRSIQSKGFRNVITRTHAELDLTDQLATRAFFAEQRPDCVFLAAAKVGGIEANSTYPAEFLQINLAIEHNVIHEAWRAGVRKLLFLGSSCIYPRLCPQPIREDYLLTGPLESTNRAYAIAKIAGIEMCRSYNEQYGTRYVAAMPTNLYGPGDNYDLRLSHVLPALIRKMHEARVRNSAEMVVWGTGVPRREFLHSDDMADACLSLMELPEEVLRDAFGSFPGDPPLVNVGSGADHSILELADLVRQIIGYEGRIVFDPGKPDGVPQKLLDIQRLRSLGWVAKIPLAEGIRRTYQDFLGSSIATTETA